MIKRVEDERSETGFQVKIDNTYSIFLLLQNQRPFLSDTGLSEDLSKTDLDGEFLDAESTEISLYPNDDPDNPFYHLSSSLFLANPEISKPPLGYYSSERFRRIKELLTRQKLTVGISILPSGIQTLLIEGDRNAQIGVDFGFPSLEAYGTHVREVVTKAKSAMIRRIYFQATVRNSQKPNQTIELTLQDKNSGSLQLRDEQEFTEDLNFYAQTYERVIRALYQEKGLPLPNRAITLKSPYDISNPLKL